MSIIVKCKVEEYLFAKAIQFTGLNASDVMDFADDAVYVVQEGDRLILKMMGEEIKETCWIVKTEEWTMGLSNFRFQQDWDNTLKLISVFGSSAESSMKYLNRKAI